MQKRAKKACFYSILLYEFILGTVKNLFQRGLSVDIHSGLIYVHFEDIFAIFEVVSWKKGKKARFNRILLYKFILSNMKNRLSFGKLVDNHLGLVQAKFGVTAGISTGISSPKRPKKLIFLHFEPIYAPCKRLPNEFKLAHGLVWLLLGYLTICTAQIGLKRKFQGL